MNRIGLCNARGGAVLVAAILLAISGVAVAGDQYKLANEGTIGADWALADGIKLAVPGYPAALAERGDNVCLALGYAINRDGTTSDFSVLKSWSSAAADGKEPANGYWDTFAQAGAHAVTQWKFKPRAPEAEPRATYTVTTISFSGKPAMDAASLRSQCAISDLTAFMQEKRGAVYMASWEKQRADNSAAAEQDRRAERMMRVLEDKSSPPR